MVDVVVETTLEDFGGDQAAQAQALDTIVERIRAADPDVVFNVSDFLPPLEAFQRNGWLPERVLSTSAQGLPAGVLTAGGLTAETLERVTMAAPYAPTKDELVEDPEVQRCVDEYDASDPEVPIDLDEMTGDALDAAANECAAFRLFVLAAEAAGDDLTPASWGAGAESLGEVDLPGMPTPRSARTTTMPAPPPASTSTTRTRSAWSPPARPSRPPDDGGTVHLAALSSR